MIKLIISLCLFISVTSANAFVVPFLSCQMKEQDLDITDVNFVKLEDNEVVAVARINPIYKKQVNDLQMILWQGIQYSYDETNQILTLSGMLPYMNGANQFNIQIDATKKVQDLIFMEGDSSWTCYLDLRFQN